jgi:AraC-like DNA-binding protein
MLRNRHKTGLGNLYTITGIPFLLTDRKARELNSFPNEFRSLYSPVFLETLLENFVLCNKPNNVLLYCVGGFYYAALTQLDSDLFLATAPVSSNSLPKPSSLQYTEWCIRPDRRDDFCRLFLDLPVLDNYQLSKLADLGKQIYSGRPAEGIDVRYKNVPEKFDHSPVTEDADLKLSIARRQKHRPERWKRAIYEAVKMGNETAFMRLHRECPIGFIGRMSRNDIRQSRYSYIAFISTMNRTVIDAGVPSEEILQLSDLYIQRMDSMDSIEEITQLRLKTGIDYCRKVMCYKGYNNYSPVTRKCCEYIREHIYEKISMRDLSAAAALNRRSLSIYFKQDTGMTVSDYINARRLEEARILLKNTDQSISWISEVLHYSTQSYFGKKYKKFFGTTPKRERTNAAARQS